jgi:hypothetical protein
MNDVLKCGGISGISCAMANYQGPTMTGDTWINTATTDATKNTDCCTAKATCGTSGYSCPAGYKMKTGVTSTTCSGAVATCAVGTTCCQADPLKCGGITGISCATDKYLMSSDTWKNTATADATKNTDCCTAKATCGTSGYSCPAGYKMKTGVTSTTCSGAVATCAVGTTCCEADPLKCGGIAGTSCATDKYMMSSDTWKNTATTDSTKNTDCCTAMATCGTSGYSCPAGYKMRTGVASTTCGGAADTCTTCCEADPLKCGGIGGISCATGKYMMTTDAWKNTATTASTKNTDCCSNQGTCAAFKASTVGTVSGTQSGAKMWFGLVVVATLAKWC